MCERWGAGGDQGVQTSVGPRAHVTQGLLLWASRGPSCGWGTPPDVGTSCCSQVKVLGTVAFGAQGGLGARGGPRPGSGRVVAGPRDV